jgi:hypothetical protein
MHLEFILNTYFGVGFFLVVWMRLAGIRFKVNGENFSFFFDFGMGFGRATKIFFINL